MLKGLLVFINILTVALMLFSAASAYINPNSIWQFSFAGMFFMPLAIVNFLFASLWLLTRKWTVLLPVGALLICYQQVRLSFGFNFKAQNESGLKVMVWNVRNFDLYNWSKNMQTRAEMMELIREENPDVICFQEFYTDQGEIMNNIEFLADSLGFRHWHFEPTVEINRWHKRKKVNHQWGEATFSKHPIVNRSRVDFLNSRNNDCIYTDILVHADTLRVYNMHLQSIHLNDEDYFLIQEMEQQQKLDEKTLRKVGSKIKKGSRWRAAQAEQVAKNIRRFSGKQIVCGDFNDVPVSYTYYKLFKAAKLKDSFVEKGWGFGKTYINPYLYLRIDYMLASANIKVNSYRTNTKVLSDHYPVCVTINW